MDSGPLNVLHDAGNQDLLTVADGVDLALFAFHIPVDEHRLFRRQFDCRRQVANQLRGVLHYLHGPAAQHVAGAYHCRISDVLGDLEGFAHRGHRCARRLGNPQSGHKFFKLVPVRRSVDSFRAGAKDRQTGRSQNLGQIDGCLAAELND